MKYICYTDNFSRMIVGHRGRVGNRRPVAAFVRQVQRLPGGGIFENIGECYRSMKIYT